MAVRAKAKKQTVKRICERDGCTKLVPPMALKHGDGFCSSLCFKVANGYMDADDAAKQRKQSAASRDGKDQWMKRVNDVTWAKSGRERAHGADAA